MGQTIACSLFLQVGFLFFDLNNLKLGCWPAVFGSSGGGILITAVESKWEGNRG
jgi:hypothetical protein